MMSTALIALGWIALVLAVGGYFLFRDTMNRIQYVEHLRIYWITRDNATDVTPRVMKAFMRHTERPYWRGHGWQFKFRRWTFQVGILDDKAESLDKQLGKGWLDGIDPKTIRRARTIPFAEQEGTDYTDVPEEA